MPAAATPDGQANPGQPTMADPTISRSDSARHTVHFILNFLITVAPSTKSGCFSGGRGKHLITMVIKQVNKEKEYLQC